MYQGNDVIQVKALRQERKGTLSLICQEWGVEPDHSDYQDLVTMTLIHCHKSSVIK